MQDLLRGSARLTGQQTSSLVLVLIAIVALTLVAQFVFALQVARLSRRVTRLTRGAENSNLEGVLNEHLERIHEAVRRMESLEQAVAVLQAKMPVCLRKATLVRYDAFDDVGGEQSFSLALLDGEGDGIVLTSVYSRIDVRVYAKAIENGRSSHALSREEERALRQVGAT